MAVNRNCTVHLKYITAAALAIYFLLLYISIPSYLLLNAGNLYRSSRNLKKVKRKSDFLHLEKKPVSIYIGSISQNLHCAPTSKLKIRSKSDGTWYLRTYARDGSRKKKGGDEYYVTYKENNNFSESPSAIAHIKDNNDGTYALRFVKSRLKMIANMPVVGKGTVTVNLIHTCGIGSLEPTLKDNWELDMKNGLVNATYKSFNHPMPLMEQPSKPKTYGQKLSHYDVIYAIGDSVMQDLFSDKRPNIKYIKRKRILNKGLVSYFLPPTEILYEDNATQSKTALILGSCAWDLLSHHQDEKGQPRFTINSHLDAVKNLLRIVKEQFPKFDIYWKGCTSLHHHVVDCKQWTNVACADRVLYLSSRRAKKLDKAQKAIMKEFNIPVLDMFDMSFEMGEFALDGRHYNETWNNYVLDYFYRVPARNDVYLQLSS